MDHLHHHQLKPRGGAVAAGREGPTAAAGPDYDSGRAAAAAAAAAAASAARGGSRGLLAAASDLLDGSGSGGVGGGKGGGRWLRRMLALVILLHLLLIAAVLYASPFDGHHRNHAHQNLPLAPEDTAAEMKAAKAASMGRRHAWGTAALPRKGAGAEAGRALVGEEEEEQEEEQDEEEFWEEEEDEEDEDDEEVEEAAQQEQEAKKKPRASASVLAAAVAAAPAAPAPARDGAARPEAFDECGVWQEGYVELHRKILAGEAPQRYLVAVAYKGGLADQLVGIVTSFYWALLTDRAFQLTVGHQKLPKFEAAFNAPFINWSRPLDPKEYTEHLYAAHRGKRHFPAGVDTETYGSRYLVNNNRASEFLLHENLWEANEQPTLFVASNRGRSFRLFDNPHHRQQLAAMGLRPETAFGCAFRFLFAPNAATLQTHADELTRLGVQGEGKAPWPKPKPALTPAGVGAARRLAVEEAGEDPADLELATLPPLRIGIQIRVGDFIFQSKAREQGLKLEDYMSYFDCATQIENHQRGHPDRKVLWYLISDSARLRQLALERFGADKLVTQTAAAHHIVCGKTDKCKDTDEAQQNAALTAAAGDMLSLSLTDFQVLTDRSGFGKVASAIGMGWHTVWFGGGYPVHRKGQADNKRAKRAKNITAHCGPKRFVSYEKLADKWSGI